MSSTTDRLVYMANQIATAFRAEGEQKAAAATFDHIWHFWDPRMRAMILEHVAAGGAGLSTIAQAAIELLATGRDPRPQTQATEFNHGADPDLMSDAG